MDEAKDAGCSDFAMLRRWHAAFCSGSPLQHRMILLETEARLLRLEDQVPPLGSASSRTAIQGQMGKIERMTVFVAENSTRNIGINEIAAVAGLHPNSAMRAFRRTCGLTILEYLTMHRIWHAQHLLTATNMKIRVLAEACGFSSPSRFYAAFERMVGQRPRDYRETMRGEKNPDETESYVSHPPSDSQQSHPQTARSSIEPVERAARLFRPGYPACIMVNAALE